MFCWDPRELNPEQAAAVVEPLSLFLIGCPGSGKTRTLTYKIAYELSRRTDKRIVVAITYTHRAADDIQERIEVLGVDTSGLWIGTIHAFWNGFSSHTAFIPLSLPLRWKRKKHSKWYIFNR